MKPVSARMQEFVRYHITGDGESNGILLKAYADKKRMNPQERYDLAYFYSVTYCVLSAIIMLHEKREIVCGPEAWAKKNRSRLIFQSDRRYVRLNGNFERMLRDYATHLTNAENYINRNVSGKRIDLEKAIAETEGWYFFGRFGAFLFVETLCLLMGYEAENTTITWKDGDTATSGLMNLFGMDRSADYFDEYDKLPPPISHRMPLMAFYGRR